jgi:hypothetical protein
MYVLSAPAPISWRPKSVSTEPVSDDWSVQSTFAPVVVDPEPAVEPLVDPVPPDVEPTVDRPVDPDADEPPVVEDAAVELDPVPPLVMSPKQAVNARPPIK